MWSSRVYTRCGPDLGGTMLLLGFTCLFIQSQMMLQNVKLIFYCSKSKLKANVHESAAAKLHVPYSLLSHTEIPTTPQL